MSTLACDLCGKGIEDTPEENAWHGVVPYPGDVPDMGMCLGCAGDPAARTVAFGVRKECTACGQPVIAGVRACESMCRDCGGDPNARTVRKRMGRALTTFVDARVPIIRNALSPKNRESFEAMTYGQKANVVMKMVARGVIV